MGKLSPSKSVAEKAKGLLVVFRHHPCDQCGFSMDGQPIANAKHEVMTSEGSIFLCSHHFNDHGVHILERSYETKPHEAES